MDSSKVVVREISEAQMTQAFVDYVRQLGIKPTGINVKFTDCRMVASARSLKWRIFGVRGFNVVGTFIARDGRFCFVLQESPSDFPFTRFVAPRVDGIVASLADDLDVMDVDIEEGKLVVTGTRRS